MVKRICLVLAAGLLLLTCSLSAPVNEVVVADAKEPPGIISDRSANQDNEEDKEVDHRILFVGNSLTYFNDLPKLVEDQARTKGVRLGTKMLAFPNYAIVDHWRDGEVQGLIKSKKYDFVVIQQGPSSQQEGYNMLVFAGKQYADLCRKNDVELAYFMVWPSRMYYHTFDEVIANYTAAANANNAILCPVGQEWKDHFDTSNDFSYYGPDQFHPSRKGSQVAAGVILNTLGLSKR